MTTCQGGGGTGTLYSYAQLEGLWENAGGAASLAPVMAAIATAESGGCSTAYNSSGASGLWQILGAVYPADQAHLFDPATNAKEAVAKYKTQGLDAWVTYTSGAYKQYLNGSVPADANVGGSSSGGTAATLTAADSSGDCLISFPQGKVLFIGTVGGGCILAKSQARAIMGSVILVNGGLVMLAGLLVLAAYGFKSSGAGKLAGTLIEGAAGGASVVGATRAAEGTRRTAARARSASGTRERAAG